MRLYFTVSTGLKKCVFKIITLYIFILIIRYANGTFYAPYYFRTSTASSALPCFSQFSQKYFWKICVWHGICSHFLYIFYLRSSSIPGIIQRRNTNIIRSSRKVPKSPPPLKNQFSQKILVYVPNLKCYENKCSRKRTVPCGQTNNNDEASRYFWNFPSAPKNKNTNFLLWNNLLVT